MRLLVWRSLVNMIEGVFGRPQRGSIPSLLVRKLEKDNTRAKVVPLEYVHLSLRRGSTAGFSHCTAPSCCTSRSYHRSVDTGINGKYDEREGENGRHTRKCACCTYPPILTTMTPRERHWGKRRPMLTGAPSESSVALNPLMSY